MLELVLAKNSHPREEDNASQMIHTNNTTDRNEIKDPSDEITFHDVKVSG
jgi:hypothetical protein